MPHVSPVMTVEKDWIDYNGHMNMAYYNVLFDRAGDEFYGEIGLGPEYARTRKLTTYTAEIHLCYVRELHLGDGVTATTRIVAHDEKRMQFYQEIHHQDGWLAATMESLALHVDMTGPRVVPMPADILERVAAVEARYSDEPMPDRVGRAISLKSRSKS